MENVLDILRPVIGMAVLALGGWLTNLLGVFLKANRDKAGWALLHEVVWRFVQSAEALGAPGSGAEKKLAAVNNSVAALTASGHAKRVEKLTGKPLREAVSDAVESGVQSLHAQQKAA